MGSVRWVVALGTVAAFATGCGGCGKQDDREPVARVPVGAPAADVPRNLEPLPAAPELNIVREPGDTSPLSVVAARPEGEHAGAIRPTVTLSKPIKSLAMVEQQDPSPVARIEPPLEGEWRWLGSASAEFIPKAQVPYA